MIFVEGPKAVQWRKDSLFTKWKPVLLSNKRYLFVRHDKKEGKERGG
jgi:hypothetical protein